MRIIQLGDRIKSLKEEMRVFKGSYYSEYACGGKWDIGCQKAYLEMKDKLGDLEAALEPLLLK